MSLKEQLQAKRELKARIEHEKQTIKDAQAKRKLIKLTLDKFTNDDIITKYDVINSIPHASINNCQYIFNNQTEISLIEFYYISTQLFCLTFKPLIINGVEYDTSETRRKIANLIIKHCTELHKLGDYARLYDAGRNIVAKQIKLTTEQQKAVNSAIVPLVQDDRELFLGFMDLIADDFVNVIGASKVEYSHEFKNTIASMYKALDNQYRAIKGVFKGVFDIELDIYNKIIADYDKINAIYNLLVKYKTVDSYDVAIKFLKDCKEIEK